MKKRFLVFIAFFLVYAAFPQPEIKAMEPRSGLIYPIGFEIPRIVAPYIVRGTINTCHGLFAMGNDTVDIFRLPLGFFQSSFLAPWHLKDGIYNLFHGAIAPFKLGYHTVCLPLYTVDILSPPSGSGTLNPTPFILCPSPIVGSSLIDSSKDCVIQATGCQ